MSLDVYASLADADTELRQFYCDMAAAEYELLADGVVNVDNEFQITVGQDAIDTPNEPSRWAPLRTARELMLLFVGKSYRFWPASPLYHLTAPVLDGDGNVTGLRASSEADITAWLANAAPQQSMRESADTDQVLCDPTAFDVPLSRIHVPLLSIAAAGGYGERANHSAAQVSSNDVTTRVVRQLPLEREAEDFGHADLLFAADAPTLVWQPLLAWLRAH